jgi:hypothetical protein
MIKLDQEILFFTAEPGTGVTVQKGESEQIIC